MANMPGMHPNLVGTAGVQFKSYQAYTFPAFFYGVGGKAVFSFGMYNHAAVFGRVFSYGCLYASVALKGYAGNQSFVYFSYVPVFEQLAKVLVCCRMPGKKYQATGIFIKPVYHHCLGVTFQNPAFQACFFSIVPVG
jgi:hypothetical protein